jgi:hypothetical protein
MNKLLMSGVVIVAAVAGAGSFYTAKKYEEFSASKLVELNDMIVEAMPTFPEASIRVETTNKRFGGLVFDEVVTMNFKPDADPLIIRNHVVSYPGFLKGDTKVENSGLATMVFAQIPALEAGHRVDWTHLPLFNKSYSSFELDPMLIDLEGTVIDFKGLNISGEQAGETIAGELDMAGVEVTPVGGVAFSVGRYSGDISGEIREGVWVDYDQNFTLEYAHSPFINLEQLTLISDQTTSDDKANMNIDFAVDQLSGMAESMAFSLSDTTFNNRIEGLDMKALQAMNQATNPEDIVAKLNEFFKNGIFYTLEDLSTTLQLSGPQFSGGSLSGWIAAEGTAQVQLPDDATLEGDLKNHAVAAINLSADKNMMIGFLGPQLQELITQGLLVEDVDSITSQLTVGNGIVALNGKPVKQL